MSELLTVEIANEYRTLAEKLPENGRQDVGERRKLRQELQNRCGLSELQAINILNGFYVKVLSITLSESSRAKLN